MIGLSLSMCLKDILAGTVAEGDVTKIVTMTAAPTTADWDALGARYRTVYWRKFDGDAAIALMQRLWAQGKIEQPRLDDPEYGHTIAGGWWITDDAAIPLWRDEVPAL
jgi:hypothetical protein